jgi:acetyltransferase-like isoleucine patch superfamily enzyme
MMHKTSEVSEKSLVGEGTKIWHYAQVRENTKIGRNCILGKNVYIDFDVSIGNNVKIQNNASIYHGTIIEDGVFIGPHVCLINDKNPRAINPDGNLKTNDDWRVDKILTKKGASIGAGSVILPGVTIGEYAMVGAGSIVTKDIPDYCLAYGNPAEIKGYVCKCGFKVTDIEEKEKIIVLKCRRCNIEIKIK